MNLRGWWVVAFLITFALCIGVPAAYATTSETEVTEEEHDGPVYLILSLAEEFETPTLGCTCDCRRCCKCKKCYKCCKCKRRCSRWCWKCWWFYKCRKCGKCDCGEQKGSGTYMVKIGTYVAGDEIGTTRFVPSDPADIVLPGNLTFEDLDGYPLTILGAFDTFSRETIHLVTPEPGEEEDPIPPAVQEAFFLAAPALEQWPEFPEPSTVEIAQFIYDTAIAINAGLAEQTSAQEILDYIFVTPSTLDAPEDAAFAEADGDLFPHDPDDDGALFEYAFKIDTDDGALAVDLCLPVEIDIKPCSSKNIVYINSYFGLLSVAVWGSDTFDVDEIDRDTVLLGGVAPKCDYIKDINCDGYDDLVVVFRIRTLVKEGALDINTTSLTLTADLKAGGCIEGSDFVVPKKWCW